MDFTLAMNHLLLFVSPGNKTIYPAMTFLTILLHLWRTCKVASTSFIQEVRNSFLLYNTCLFDLHCFIDSSWGSFRVGMACLDVIVNNWINIRRNWAGSWQSDICWSREYLCPKHYWCIWTSNYINTSNKTFTVLLNICYYNHWILVPICILW